jgi:hypothetical protein
MGNLENWGATVRRHPARVTGVVVVAGALLAGGVVLATRASRTSAPSALTSRRIVALGDSVPYGHGLANPYLTSRPGLPLHARSEGPSLLAYPTLVTRALGLIMSVRRTNCALTGDQLAISGAVANADDDTRRDTQCPVPPRQARNLGDELAAADLSRRPARLVLLQVGADDIDFGSCLEYELAHVLGARLDLGTPCVANGAVTPAVASRLDDARKSIAGAIESMAPHARTIAVLNYYQPVPSPQDLEDSGLSGLRTNLVCTGLEANPAPTYEAAQVVSMATNAAVGGAVADARAHGVHNVELIDLSGMGAGHGMCTKGSYFFSGEPIGDATVAADLARIAAAKACSTAGPLRDRACLSLEAGAAQAEQQLKDSVWRAAHPTAAGQRALAAAIEQQLRPGHS